MSSSNEPYDSSDPSSYAPRSLDELLDASEVLRALLLIWRCFALPLGRIVSFFGDVYEYLPQNKRRQFVQTDLKKLVKAGLLKDATSQTIFTPVGGRLLDADKYRARLDIALEELAANLQRKPVVGSVKVYIPGPDLQDLIEECWLQFGELVTTAPTEITRNDSERLSHVREYHSELRTQIDHEREHKPTGFVQPRQILPSEYAAIMRESLIARLVASSDQIGLSSFCDPLPTLTPARALDPSGRLLLSPHHRRAWDSGTWSSMDTGEIYYARYINVAGLDADQLDSFLHHVEHAPAGELAFWLGDRTLVHDRGRTLLRY